MQPANVFSRRWCSVLHAAAAALIAILATWTPGRAEMRVFVTTDDSILRDDFATSTLTSLVSGSADSFNFTGLAFGSNGNLFAGMTGPISQVVEYNPNTGAPVAPTPFVFYQGNPPSPDPHDVIIPQGMAFSRLNHNLYIADVGVPSNVHMYDPTGASLGAVADPTKNLGSPTDVAFDFNGNLYAVNAAGFNGPNVMVTAGGTGSLTNFYTYGSNPDDPIIPSALTFGPDSKLYVLDLGGAHTSITRLNADSSFDSVVVSYGASLFQPTDLDFGEDGKLYVLGTDLGTGSAQILRYTPDGLLDGSPIDLGFGVNTHFLTFEPVIVPLPGTALLMTLSLSTLTVIRRRMVWPDVRRTGRRHR